MSYSKHFKRTYIFRNMPELAEKLVKLKPGENIRLDCAGEEEAKAMVHRLYSFQNSYFGVCRFRISRLQYTKIHIDYPKVEVSCGKGE